MHQSLFILEDWDCLLADVWLSSSEISFCFPRSFTFFSSLFLKLGSTLEIVSIVYSKSSRSDFPSTAEISSSSKIMHAIWFYKKLQEFSLSYVSCYQTFSFLIHAVHFFLIFLAWLLQWRSIFQKSVKSQNSSINVAGMIIYWATFIPVCLVFRKVPWEQKYAF